MVRKVNKMKCFYHSADNDGACSAAIVKYKYPDCQLIGFNYSDKFPFDEIEPNEKVYMVDVSLHGKEMLKLYEMLRDNFIWIDHHKSKIDEISEKQVKNTNKNLNELIKGIRQNGKAGCELTWEYIFPNDKMPEIIRLLGRYDVWDLTENVLEFQYGFRINNTNPNNQNLWSNYFNNNELVYIDIDRGKTILSYIKQENERYCSNAFEIEFDGYKAIVVNRANANSQLFESIWDNTKYDIMITFSMGKKRNWNCSFYTDKEGIDVSKIAVKYGGGGHIGAAGCTFTELPF